MDKKVRTAWLAIPVLVLAFTGCTERRAASDAWKMADAIVEEIRLPSIPEPVFELAEYGGSGDGITDNKEAFDRAIAACAELDGGTILVEAGDYLVNGPIHLGSHMNLHLAEGARIFFGNEPADYLPMVLTSWEGTRCYNFSPFIYAHRANDVAITGKGTIDGEGTDPWNGWKRLQTPDQQLIRRMNNDSLPLAERLFGEGHFLRPHLVQFYDCENVLVEGVHLTDAPFWCLHFVYSSHITVRGISYDAHNENNDGIDPESSQYMLIEDVTFGNKDDNIAIKAGRDREARNLGIPSRNIVVRNCRFSGHNAVAIGSEMSGGVDHVFVEDCSFAGSVAYGFYLKGNRDRGGSVSHIYGRNLEFDTTRAVVVVDSNYKNQGSCCPPSFSNIHLDNITASHSLDHGIYLKGSEEMPVDSLTIRRLRVETARVPLFFEHVGNIRLRQVRINGETLAGSEHDLTSGEGLPGATGGPTL